MSVKYSYPNKAYKEIRESEADSQALKTPGFIKKTMRGLEFINTTKGVIPLKEPRPSCLDNTEAQITVSLRNLEPEDSTFICGIHVTSHIYRRKIRYNINGEWYSLADAITRVLALANR